MVVPQTPLSGGSRTGPCERQLAIPKIEEDESLITVVDQLSE